MQKETVISSKLSSLIKFEILVGNLRKNPVPKKIINLLNSTYIPSNFKNYLYSVI